MTYLRVKNLAVMVTVVLLAVAALTGCARTATPVSAEKAKEKAESGLDAYKKGNFTEAIEKLEAVVEDEPDNASSQKTLGQSYEATGKLQQAARAYKASLKLDEGQSQVRYNLGIIYKSQGETDKAIAELEKAIANNSGFAAARIVLGDLYVQVGEADKAKEQYQNVIDAEPFGIDMEQVKSKLAGLD